MAASSKYYTRHSVRRFSLFHISAKHKVSSGTPSICVRSDWIAGSPPKPQTNRYAIEERCDRMGFQCVSTLAYSSVSEADERQCNCGKVYNGERIMCWNCTGLDTKATARWNHVKCGGCISTADGKEGGPSCAVRSARL